MSRIPAFPCAPAMLLVLVQVMGCSAPEVQHSALEYAGPEKECFLEEETEIPWIDDPSEPFNRAMSGFNHGLIVGLLNPLCHGYRWITGPSFRTSFGRFFLNLRFPVRLFGNLLQAQWGGAGRETARFGINLTVGLLGFFDPAKERWEIEPSEEDVGRAFEAWGWEHSNYLVLPFFGPRTNRDALALPFDLALNALTWIPGAATVETINNGTDKADAYFKFVESNYDPYQRGRYLYVLNREWRAVSYEAIPSRDRSIETLGAAFLTNKKKEFPNEKEARSVHVMETGREFPYDLWLQEKPAPIVCILPGLGGHRVGSSSLGLAEMVHDAGFSAIAISNAMNWEFAQNAASVDLPGFAPVDARDVHRALGLILADVEKAYPGRITKKAVLGISLGAFHTLFLAAAEEADAASFPPFDAYLAINPPVRLAVGLDQLDNCYCSPMAIDRDMRTPWVDTLIGKLLGLVHSGTLAPGDLLPFDKTEAEFIIGIAFRATLSETIVASQDRKDLGVLKTPYSKWRRAGEFREANDYSFREYMIAFALPYFRQRDPKLATSADLLAPCDVRRFEAKYRGNPKVFVFTNENDFLLEASDKAWLHATFGPDRLDIAPEGGHLGNLYEPKIQERLVDRLKAMLK